MTKPNNIRIERRILAPAEGNSLRKKMLIILILDRSGSMALKRKEVYPAVHQFLKELAEENLTNVDMEFYVYLATFNDQITECTDKKALAPEDVGEMFGEDDYVCSGSTGLAAVYNYLDSLYSRSGDGLFSGPEAGSPMPLPVMITDMEETDSSECLAAAQRRLMSNQHFAASKRIVVFVGSSEKKKQAAAALAGPENVICVGTNLKDYLAPTLLGSTLIHSDSTHISNSTTTPEETGKRIQDKTNSGKKSKDQLIDKDLEKELEDYLSGKTTMTEEELRKKMDEYLS